MQANNSNDEPTTSTSGNVEITRKQASAADEDLTPEQEPKKMRLDIVVKESNPNIDNLEHFPTKVLLNIFEQTDDTGLLNLAEISYRFATIMPIVFQRKYDKAYFVVNDEGYGGDRETYRTIFDRYGKFIKALEVNCIHIDQNQWLMNILQDHQNHIDKLALHHCVLESHDILSVTTSVTHLTLRNVRCFGVDVLPEWHNLMELDIRGSSGIQQSLFHQIIVNHPPLEILKCDAVMSLDTLTSIGGSLGHLKEFALGEVCSENQLIYVDSARLIPNKIDSIIRSFKGLEYLALSFGPCIIELSQQLGMSCTSLKRLELEYGSGSDFGEEVLLAGELFPQIESLNLFHWQLDHQHWTKIGSMVEHLSHLRELYLKSTFCEDVTHADMLSLFQKCPSLEIITSNTIGCNMMRPFLTDTQFFKDFLETVITRKPNARIEVQQNGQTVGLVSQNGIVWQNMLVHWTGCDTNQSAANVQLLDLAEHAMKPDAMQKNMLDSVFDYLDLHSLSAFAETSTQSKQLVESYIQLHSQQHGTFTMTNQFKPYDALKKGNNFDPSIFAQRVTALKINHSGGYYPNDVVKVTSTYEYLDNLSFSSECEISFDILPQVQHLTMDAPKFLGYSDLHNISVECPNVESVTFKKATPFHDYDPGKSAALQFRNLKKFTFQYRSETQMNKLQKMFENTATQLVPIHLLTVSKQLTHFTSLGTKKHAGWHFSRFR